MYKIERLLLPHTWISLSEDYADLNGAVARLNQKRQEYPHGKYRVIEFEVLDV